MSQLAYSKLILSKVMYYPEIFRKEYLKFRHSLRKSSKDLHELEVWVQQQKVGIT